MSIQYDTIQGGVIIFLSLWHIFFVNFLRVFSGLCGIFGRRLARTGHLASTFFCWLGLLFFFGMNEPASELIMSCGMEWSTFS